MRGPAASTSCPGQVRSVSEGQQVLPAVPGNSRSSLCVRSHGVNQLSRVTLAPVRGPAVLTRSPGRIGCVPVGPWCRAAVPGDLSSSLRPHGVELLPRVTQAVVRGPAVLTITPG